MVIYEKCACGASFNLEDPTQSEVTPGMTMALADFRAGHRCPAGGSEKAMTGGVMPATPSSAPF